MGYVLDERGEAGAHGAWSMAEPIPWSPVGPWGLLWLCLTLLCLLVTAGTSPAAAAPTGDPLAALFDDYFEALLVLNPVYATQIGDHRFDDRLTQDGRPEYRRQLRALTERTQAALAQIDPATLTGHRRTHYDALEWTLQATLDGLEFPEHLLPLVPGLGMPGSFAHLASGHGAHPFHATADYDAFLSRCAEFELWVDTAIDNLRQGLKRRVTHPRLVVETVLSEIHTLTATREIDTSAFFGPVRRFPDSMPAAERTRLAAAWQEAIENQVVPAYRRLATFLESEYLPRCRVTLGLAHLPQGRKWYAHRVRYFTTTQLKPAKIFALGEREVERIAAEMEAAAARAGFGNRIAYQQSLQSDPSNYLPGDERTLAAYEEIRSRVEQALPALFLAGPMTPLDIRPVETYRRLAAPGGFYERPSADSTAPGIFYFNLRGGNAYRPNMEALFLHEGLPGHHFQIAGAMENEALPRFLRYGYFGAYIEGWGLYAESLGREVDLYTDPASAFGRLVFELGRAGRLLGDLGIHHRGWSRSEASEYLGRRHLDWPLSELQRYSTLPGQALAYKTGELEILRLRDHVRSALGDRFDIRRFHQLVLEDGPLPLTVLEAKIERWLAEAEPVYSSQPSS